MKYLKLIFIQNINEDETLRKLFNDESSEAIFNYLMENYAHIFNFEDSHTTPIYGQSDRIYSFGEYDLIVNYKLDYVGIQKRVMSRKVLTGISIKST